MNVEKGDYLLHKNTENVYSVRSINRATTGGTLLNLYNYRTQGIEQFRADTLDQYFTKIEKDLGPDLSKMKQVGPKDYSDLQAVRREYNEWKATWPNPPWAPKDREQYTNTEIQEILKEDNTVGLYQLAMMLDRSITALNYVKTKAASMDAGKWKGWKEKGVPGDSAYWQIQTVVKDMGGSYNPLLDQKPELEIHHS